MRISYYSNRRGVAPVIATLLMIAVAVAMSVIIFMWSQGFLSQTSSSTGGQQGSQNQAAQSSVSIELATFVTGTTSGNAGTSCGTSLDSAAPKITLVVRNVGAVAITLGSLTISGGSGNSGFTGAVTIPSVSSTVTTSSAAAVGSESDGTWKYSTTSATAAKGASVTITVCQTSTTAVSATQIKAGDVINLKQTTSVGTFAQSQFTVP